MAGSISSKPRKVSHRGAKQKGTKGEVEFVEAMKACGIPCQRVLASGAFRGAKADVKVGVRLKKDGSYPEQDESEAIMRVEVKNRADNPESLHTTRNNLPTEGVLFGPCKRDAPEALWKYLEQDAITKAVVLRRAKVPTGAIANEDWNQVFMVAMGLEDFSRLFRKAYWKELGLDGPPED